MPTVNWNEGSPPDTASAGLGDDEIRSLKTSIRVGLDGEHNWPSGGGADTGYHRFGSARPYFGAQSLVSSSGSDARLMLTSDTSRLFGVGSVGTSFLGGPTVISAGSFPGGLPQRAIWVEEFGIGQTKSGTTSITLPNSGYSGAAYIFLTTFNNNPTEETVWVTTVAATSFTVRSNATNDLGASSTTFFWRSIGSRTL